jgi:dihydrofolate reductase
MRRLITAGFLSLDGIMQAPGGPGEDDDGGFAFGGWMFPHGDDVTDAFIGDWFDEPFDLLLGRRTYDIFAAYWPTVGKDMPIGQMFNRVTKYVATSSREPLAWENSVALHDPARQVAELKRGEGPRLITQGSTVLLKTLLRHGLVDEFRLMTFPVILGTGKRLFGDGAMPMGLKTLRTGVSSRGVLTAVYVPDGTVRTGSFMPE